MAWWVVPLIQATGLLLSWQAQQQQSRQQQSQYNAQAAEYRRYANEQYKITQKKMGFIRLQSLRKEDELRVLGQLRGHEIKIQGRRATSAISAETGSSGAVVGYGTPGQIEFEQVLTANRASANMVNSANLKAHNLQVSTSRQLEIMQDSAELARTSMVAKAEWATAAAAAKEASRLIEGAGTLLTGTGTMVQTQYKMPVDQRIPWFRP